jgi:hypothetical protein
MQATHNLYYTLFFTCPSDDRRCAFSGLNLYNVITTVPRLYGISSTRPTALRLSI